VLIGVFAGYSYRLISKQSIAVGLAATVGTLTNTIGVLGLAVVKGYLPLEAAIGVGATHGTPEVIVAILITLLVMKVLDN
jgi:uncharacterized membrane protein